MLNRQTMIISHDSGIKERNICGYIDCEATEETHSFYSLRQAIDSGWVNTTHRKYCKPGKPLAWIWICPSCAKNI